MKLSAYIDGIGLLGPGLNGWPDSRAVLRDNASYQAQKTVLPAPQILPAAERRRAGMIVKLTLATGIEAVNAAGLEASSLPIVFSASGGDGENCHAICETLASNDRQISPTRFHNSVHNAAAGYWSIATGAMTSASVLCAYDACFGAGLLEALTQASVDRTRCLLLACDTPYPEPLHSARPILDALGIALVLSPERSTTSIAYIAVSLTETAAHTLDHPVLETLRNGIPAARGLPLLYAIAQQRQQQIVLDYLDPVRLAVDVSPC